MGDQSKIEVELDFLSSLEEGEVITQMTLSKRIRVSIGLVNALLKRAVHKGYVKARSAPYKRYAYYLTPTGFAEKSRLVAEYLEISLDFFRVARADYGELLARAEACGIAHVVFIGGGELAEIALLSAREAGVEVVAILDRGANRSAFHGIPVVQGFDELPEAAAVVIADAKQPQLWFDLAAERFPEHQVLAPRLMRITRRPPAVIRIDEAAE